MNSSLPPSSSSSVPSTPAPATAAWNPWPWGIAGFLTGFACLVAGFGVFAARQHFDLVRVDYYEEELRYQDRIDALSRGREAGKGATLTLDGAGRGLSVRLPAGAGSDGAAGRLHLYRPSDASLDRQLALSPGRDGVQHCDLAGMKAGFWRARLTWREGSEEFMQESSFVLR